MLPEVHEVVLDNGFRALLVERHSLPVVGTAMWYRTGARDERTGESGLSHFLEHMMFKGTDSYAKGEIDLLTSKMGGSNNAFTDHDSTVYHFSLPAETWVTALEIEAGRMRGCSLDPVEFEAEKSVVLEELAMGLDDPWTSLFQAVEACAFGRHPYRRPIIGWKEDVERVTAAQMRAYYERNYGVNRAFLVVVGAIDVARTTSLIERLFGDLPQAESRAEVIREPAIDGERRAVIYAPGTISRMAFATPTCRIGEPDDLIFDVIGQVLGHSRSSRLRRRLMLDESIASHASVLNDVRLDPGLFWVYAELHPGVEPALAEARIRDEIERLVAKGITKDELQRAMTQIRASFLFEDEAVLGTALKIGRFEGTTAAGYRSLGEVEAAYDRITLEDVQATAAKYLRGPWSAVWSLPESQRGSPAYVPAAVSPRRAPRTAAAKPATKRKPAARKSKQSVVKKAAAKKPVTKQPVAKKAAKKPVAKQPVKQQPATKKSGRKRPATKKSIKKKPVAKKPAKQQKAKKKVGAGRPKRASPRAIRRRRKS